jgi:hypothetical protein
VDGLHKVAVTAQMEVSGRFVESVDMPDAALFRSGEL